mmetsp:Transcript_24019/g.32901  ORF Transcript_24019/g.32901 Transcript_24019/m.32901 type:complete len:139 (+) Transcript_24019:279-695(+)
MNPPFDVATKGPWGLDSGDIGRESGEIISLFDCGCVDFGLSRAALIFVGDLRRSAVGVGFTTNEVNFLGLELDGDVGDRALGDNKRRDVAEGEDIAPSALDRWRVGVTEEGDGNLPPFPFGDRGGDLRKGDNRVADLK